MLDASQVALFLPAAFLMGISPGANNLLAFNSATHAGWLKATKGLIGRNAAWLLLVFLVAAGLDVVFEVSPILFDVVRSFGVAYLFYLGWAFWNAPVACALDRVPAKVLARREFLTLMGNPKAYLLLTAFLPQFVVRNDAVTVQLLLLGGIYLMAESLAAMVWIGVGARLGTGSLGPGRRRALNRGSAVAMVLAAGALMQAGGR